jgi:serine phosphatase RsbU (regulator of sigma subunit)
MILFTDGVIDTISNSGALYGMHRLQQAISTAATGSAREMLDAIDGSLATFAGDMPPADDCTIVVVKRNP